MGSFPEILSEDGPLIFEPGIVIPQVPWDALWNGVAQWFGITNAAVSKFAKFKFLEVVANSYGYI